MLGEIFEKVKPQRKSYLNIKPEPIWRYQLRKLLPTLLVVYTPTFFIIFATIIIHLQTNIQIADLTRDPAALSGAPFYVGLLSNIGILFWSFTAAICLFCSAVLRRGTNNRELPPFLFFSGIITIILLLDDLFLFHDSVYTGYLNIPGKAVYAAYGIMISLYTIRFRMTILNTDFLLLLFAFGFFGLSLIFSMRSIYLPVDHYLLEDGAKLFGIMTWFTYFTRIGLRQVKYAILFRQKGLAID